VRLLAALILASTACIPEAGVAPCTTDGECLVGFECVEQFCLECEPGTCGAIVMGSIGAEGGRLCGPDEACVEILPGALSSSISIGLRRSRRAAPPLDVRSVVYEVLPFNARLAVPARISIPISPSTRLEDIRVYVSDGITAGFAPLPGSATPVYANGSSDRFGVFVAVRN